MTTRISLGKAIADKRKKKGLTGKAVASSAGISASLLSQIERGSTTPSLPTLDAIAKALDEPLFNFFLPDHSHKETMDVDDLIVRNSGDGKCPSQLGLKGKYEGHQNDMSEWVALSQGLDPSAELLLINLPPDVADTRIPNAHRERELAYVIRGTATIILEDCIRQLHAGDVILIPSYAPHKWTNLSPEPISILSVVIRI